MGGTDRWMDDSGSSKRDRGQRSRRQTMRGSMEVRRAGEECPVPEKTMGVDQWERTVS